MANRPSSGCTTRQSSLNPDRWFLDFDVAAPGGQGGASVLLFSVQKLVSIDGVRKNLLLPPRSTGGLIAIGLRQMGMPKPNILEGYNVEKRTAAALSTGQNGQTTPIGNMLEDVVLALGGTITQWQPVPYGTIWHLRVHIDYP